MAGETPTTAGSAAYVKSNPAPLPLLLLLLLFAPPALLPP
jgi:hypothetical protein